MAPAIGSSPRWRGTLQFAEIGHGNGRFIPALAGNATSRPPSSGGFRGSSPRWRGTPAHDAGLLRRHRFIPALAGNAWQHGAFATPPTVHPRAGGERQAIPEFHIIAGGSSPRWRGTRGARRHHVLAHRFIPALAGNAPGALRRACLSSVHPRAGGERAGGFMVSFYHGGSSPRWRGTHARFRQIGLGNRFIPALAGNAAIQPNRRRRCSVHPRAGGERGSSFPAAARTSGSSPRWRGTLKGAPRQAGDHRFIPALAGNALSGRA